MKLELDMTVYHQDVYDGREPLTVIGIKKDTVELEGDYSGGTNNVCQSDWLSISGVLFEKSEPKESSLNLEDINGIEILQFLESQIDDNEDFSDISLDTPFEFEGQSVAETRDGELMYSLSFTCYFNNWGTHQPIDGNEIQITNSGVRVLVGEAFEGDGSDDELEKILTEWLKTHKFQSTEEVETKFRGMIDFSRFRLGEVSFKTHDLLDKIIKELQEAKNLMK
jgi:hypothetical protein